MITMEKIDNKEFTKRNLYNVDDSGKIFLIILFAPLVLSLLFYLFASQIAKGQEIDVKSVTSNIWYNVIYIICNFILYISIYLLYSKSKKISYNAIKLDFKLKWYTYLLMIGIGVISLFGIQYFISAINNLLKVMHYPVEEELPIINPTGVGTYFLALFLLAVIPAIEEELIFRGIIFNGLRSRFKDYQAILISAVLFALMHGNLQQFVYPIFLGIILAWVVMRTGSLVSSILVHMINNALVVTFAFIKNLTGWELAFINKWWFYIVAVLILGATFAILFLIDKFYFKNKSKEEIEKKKTDTKYLLISSMIALSLFIALIILSF